MVRFLAIALSVFVALPLWAQSDLSLQELVRINAADAVAKAMSDPNNPGQAEVSGLSRVGDEIVLCATTDARNRSGIYIGRDYWEIRLTSDGSKVLKTTNVTGLLSPCYGADYVPFEQLLRR